ncbi:glycosyltransferase [Limosilactobacillus reuteri]|nr:glycosyltransferase [Limosilactobacillus reuteri]
MENLIKAFKKLKTTKKLVIAGGASDTNGFFNKMKQMASSDNRIIFTGFVDGNLLSELYSNAYLYVLPSKLEGMPIGLMEAMAFGNCCLVSDIPECKNVVMNHGIVFKNNDFNDLYLKLEELVKNPKKVEMLKSKSADYILNKYQWTTVINKTLELYKESINENTK